MLVAHDDSVRRIQDMPCASVVLFEFYDGTIFVVLFEPQDIAEIRTPPTVYTLPVITDHSEIPLLAHKQLDELVLCRVGILILIDHDVGKVLLPLFTYFFMRFKHLDRFPYQ